MAFLSQNQVLPVAIGLAVIGGFMMISYWYKIHSSQRVGFTSEIVGLATYLIGALVYHEYFWVASTLAIAGIAGGFLVSLRGNSKVNPIKDYMP